MSVRVVKIRTNPTNLHVNTKETRKVLIKIRTNPTDLHVNTKEPRKILINIRSNIIPVEQKKKVFINLTPKSSTSEKKTDKKIKFHITQKVANNDYEVAIAEQKPKFIAHEPVILPSQLHLEPFFYQNYCYLIDQSSKYIFLPDDIQKRNIVAVGRLVEQPIDPKKITKTSYPVANRKIDWYLRFELDTPIPRV